MLKLLLVAYTFIYVRKQRDVPFVDDADVHVSKADNHCTSRMIEYRETFGTSDFSVLICILTYSVMGYPVYDVGMALSLIYLSIFKGKIKN